MRTRNMYTKDFFDIRVCIGVEVEKGETILIPTNAKHAVKNIGTSTLKLLTVFPYPDRTKGHVDYKEYRIPEWE